MHVTLGKALYFLHRLAMELDITPFQTASRVFKPNRYTAQSPLLTRILGYSEMLPKLGRTSILEYFDQIEDASFYILVSY